MLKLNIPTKTKTGEIVVPYFINSGSVYVLDRSKNEKILSLEDFDFSKKKPGKQLIVVAGQRGGVVYEDKKTEAITPETTKPETEPEIEQNEPNLNSSVKIAITGNSIYSFEKTISQNDADDFYGGW